MKTAYGPLLREYSRVFSGHFLPFTAWQKLKSIVIRVLSVLQPGSRSEMAFQRFSHFPFIIVSFFSSFDLINSILNCKLRFGRLFGNRILRIHRMLLIVKRSNQLRSFRMQQRFVVNLISFKFLLIQLI